MLIQNRMGQIINTNARPADEQLDPAQNYQVELEEFERLVKDMSAMGFSSSKELSAYIRENKLGYNYPNISGVLKMRLQGKEFEFDGGIKTDWYRALCHRLNLSNRSSGAEVLNFTSYGRMRRL